MARDYDESSQYQRAVADTAAERIARCVEAVPVAAGSTFVVADYGSSTGANSMAAMRAAVAAARAREPEGSVAAIHNDLPTNDWNQLFRKVTSSPDSYLTLPGPPVIPVASAVSFFEPAAPERSVHFAMSFSAAHWLRTQPAVSVPDGFYFSEATGAARAELARQADADWTAFLVARADELVAGGRLLVQMVGSQVAPDGAEPDVTARRLLGAMHDVATEMADAGLLDPKAVRDYVLPVYARTAEEARAPLTRADSPVRSAFREIECRTDPVANPYFTQWTQDHDGAAYAQSYANFVRGFTESSLREHLFTVESTSGDPASTLDDYFSRLTARFAADPERDRFEDWTLTVVFERD
jgi:hypothetical protein